MTLPDSRVLPTGFRGMASPKCRLKGLPVPRIVTSHRLAVNGVRRRVLGIAVALFALAALPVFSQVGPNGNAAPGDLRPAESPAATEPSPEPPAATESTPAPVDDLSPVENKPVSPDTGLPDDFVPPAAKPEHMTLRKPLMTQAEIQKEDGDLRRVGQRGVELVLYAGELNPANEEAIRRWANLRIAQLTAVDEWSKLGEITSTEILLPLRTAGLKQSNPNRVLEFRRAVCKALTEACKSVLDNNFYVRMQAVRILSELNVRESETVGNRRPAVSYVPAMEPLLDVIADPEQPEALKILAAVGVARTANHADIIPAELKFRAADILTKELARADTPWWYQMRLAAAAAAIEFEIDRNGQPIIVDTLLAVIADGNRSCMARTAAAKALGRTPIAAGKFDEKAAADGLVQLARDMSLAYNKAPDKVQWYECFINLYLTFKPNAGEDPAGLPQNSLIRKGSLPAALDSAAQRITPVVKHVVNQPIGKQKAIPGELIQRLSELLKVADKQP